MSKQTVYLLVEPADAVPIWFSRVVAGLRESCMKYRLSMAQLESAAELDNVDEPPVCALVICSQNNWTQHVVRELKARRVMPVLLGAIPDQFGDDVSGIMLARRIFIERIMDYFLSCNRRKMALVGVNKNASNDSVKTQVFLQNAKSMGLASGQEDIYWIDSDISSSVDQCLRNASRYDAVICSNDYVAVVLLAQTRKRGIRVPEDLYVAGLGNAYIGRYTEPTLTSTAKDEFFEMGRQAINMWHILMNNPYLSNVTITVNTEIIPRGSTAFSEPCQFTHSASKDAEPVITIGTESQMVRNLENCLRSCDSLDTQILRHLLQGRSNEQIEGDLFLAHSSLYYRLKKLYQLANVGSRSELERLFKFYLPNF